MDSNAAFTIYAYGVSGASIANNVLADGLANGALAHWTAVQGASLGKSLAPVPVPVPAVPTGPERHAIEAVSNARDALEEAFGHDHYYRRLIDKALKTIEDEERRGRPTAKSEAYWKA